MITKTINGREYRLREIHTVSAHERSQKYSEAFEDEKKRHKAYNFSMLWENLLDANGEKYPTLDAAMDSVDIRDFNQLISFIWGDDDPLPLTTDSATV
jgi:hypothetical protein